MFLGGAGGSREKHKIDVSQCGQNRYVRNPSIRTFLIQNMRLKNKVPKNLRIFYEPHHLGWGKTENCYFRYCAKTFP